MATPIINRADAEAVIREQVVQAIAQDVPKEFRIHVNGKKDAEHDKQADKNPCFGLHAYCLLGKR